MNITKLKGKTISGRVINTASDLSEILLEEMHVATVPCESFGTGDFVRWSYATSMENIKEGLDRLEKFLNR